MSFSDSEQERPIEFSINELELIVIPIISEGRTEISCEIPYDDQSVSEKIHDLLG